MDRQPSTPSSIRVFARWRPPAKAEAVIKCAAVTPDKAVTKYTTKQAISIRAGNKSYTSNMAFNSVFSDTVSNATLSQAVLAPVLPRVLQEGATCNFFAYGHSGSGKTHTIIGYDYEHDEDLGLCLVTASSLFAELDVLNKGRQDDQLGIALSVFEHTECKIRESPDGKTHIRGSTEILEGGKVRLREVLELRQVGSSSVHNESSRTHAVLQLEIITATLMNARNEVIERQSELVPVGKHATDVSMRENEGRWMQGAGGKWVANPNAPPINQQAINEAETEKAKFEALVVEEEKHVATIMNDENRPACLGGKVTFVGLAGAEYQVSTPAGIANNTQSSQEKQEGRQINTDLLALKEVIRAVVQNLPRIPFRSSPLTMVLRDHFVSGGEGVSTMIVTLSPEEEQYAATLNTLKYAGLVGVAGF